MTERQQTLPAMAMRPVSLPLQLGLIAAGMLLLLWPAFVNGFPFTFPDSVVYLGNGQITLSALLHPAIRPVPDMRSEYYVVVAHLLTRFWLHPSPWPLATLNSLLASLTLWITARCMVPRYAAALFLPLVALLSVGTGLSWYVSCLLTDSYGSDTYLSLFLLLYYWKDLSRSEHWLLIAIVWWGACAHSTHLPLAILFVMVAAVLHVLGRSRFPLHRKGLIAAMAALLACIAAQSLLHWDLYGVPSIGSPSPPYIVSRLIEDGPGARYLQEHCGEHADWTICRRTRSHMPASHYDFLFSPTGVWTGATAAERQALRTEEKPFVLAILHTYPTQQLHASWQNFRTQLSLFDLSFLDFNAPFTGATLDSVIPGTSAAFLRSPQNTLGLPLHRFAMLQAMLLAASVLSLAVLTPVAWIKRRDGAVALLMLFIPLALANALLCGVLSAPDARYQGRIIWMLPLIAMLMAGTLARPVGIERHPR